MLLKTKEQLKKLEERQDSLTADIAALELRYLTLERSIMRVFQRVSRDFVVHSEKLDPDKEDNPPKAPSGIVEEYRRA